MFWQKKKDFSSKLFNQDSFYSAFLKDLGRCNKEVVIESPYMTASRMELLYPTLEELIARGVKVRIVTRDPVDHEDQYMRDQATNEILKCQEVGINIVLLSGFHHRKLAIIDKDILWEGSLNILSQTKSLEIMRRIQGKGFAEEMMRFLNLGSLIR